MTFKVIIKLVFTIVIFTSWITQSMTNDDYNFSEFSDLADLQLCEDSVGSFNISSTQILDIGPDFIRSPLIVCLNFRNNHIRRIAPNAFGKLPNLTNLLLSDNNISKPEELFSFGSHKNLKILIMNNATSSERAKQVEISGEYPKLEVLLARNNSIYDLLVPKTYKSYSALSGHVTPQANVPFPKLKILDLSENDLQSTSFVNLIPNSLQFLSLYKNRLNALNLGQRGANLTMLNLHNNTLYYVTNKAYGVMLGYMENLQYLSMSENEIVGMAADSFQDTKKLIYLNVSSNKMSRVFPETFAKLHSLKTLDLSANKLPNVPEITLNETDINVLSLACNEIKKVPPMAFLQTKKLTKLLLGGNQIVEIDDRAFDHLFLLLELDLSSNKLSSLPVGWADALLSLKYLDFSDNMFTSIESLSLPSTLPLTEMYVMKNPLQSVNVKYLENLPQNLTVNLAQRPSFAQSCK